MPKYYYKLTYEAKRMTFHPSQVLDHTISKYFESWYDMMIYIDNQLIQPPRIIKIERVKPIENLHTERPDKERKQETK